MKKYILPAVVLAMGAGSAMAQTDDRGAEVYIEVEKKLSKKWNLNIGGEYEWKDEMALTNQIRGFVGGEYKAWKFLKFGAGYSLIADKKKKRDIFVYRNRFMAEATASVKFLRFTASWRPRLQATLFADSDKDAAEQDDYRWVLRNRLALKYNVPKVSLKPYVSYEFFNRIASDVTPAHYKNRFRAGLEYTIAKQHTLDLGYKRDDNVLENKKYHFDAALLGYKFSF